jgi:hypothetical protein
MTRSSARCFLVFAFWCSALNSGFGSPPHRQPFLFHSAVCLIRGAWSSDVGLHGEDRGGAAFLEAYIERVVLHLVPKIGRGNGFRVRRSPRGLVVAWLPEPRKASVILGKHDLHALAIDPRFPREAEAAKRLAWLRKAEPFVWGGRHARVLLTLMTSEGRTHETAYDSVFCYPMDEPGDSHRRSSHNADSAEALYGIALHLSVCIGVALSYYDTHTTRYCVEH